MFRARKPSAGHCGSAFVGPSDMELSILQRVGAGPAPKVLCKSSPGAPGGASSLRPLRAGRLLAGCRAPHDRRAVFDKTPHVCLLRNRPFPDISQAR